MVETGVSIDDRRHIHDCTIDTATVLCGRLAPFRKQYTTAQDAFQRGDAEPIKALWSHADDVTLFGALGGHERGWAAIGSRLSQVARMNTSGAHKGDDVLTTIVGADLALMVRIEHIPNSGAGAGVGAVTHLRSLTRRGARAVAGVLSTVMPILS